MKALIAAVLFTASAVAHAGGIVANAINQAGGRIELSDIQTQDPTCKGWIAKTWGGTTPDNYGCWQFGREGDTVVIKWIGNSSTKTYPAKDFNRTPYGEQVMNQKSL